MPLPAYGKQRGLVGFLIRSPRPVPAFTTRMDMRIPCSVVGEFWLVHGLQLSLLSRSSIRESRIENCSVSLPPPGRLSLSSATALTASIARACHPRSLDNTDASVSGLLLTPVTVSIASLLHLAWPDAHCVFVTALASSDCPVWRLENE
jgi:hypothetical protein